MRRPRGGHGPRALGETRNLGTPAPIREGPELWHRQNYTTRACTVGTAVSTRPERTGRSCRPGRRTRLVPAAPRGPGGRNGSAAAPAAGRTPQTFHATGAGPSLPCALRG